MAAVSQLQDQIQKMNQQNKNEQKDKTVVTEQKHEVKSENDIIDAICLGGQNISDRENEFVLFELTKGVYIYKISQREIHTMK